ncbi:MAG: vitamin K epoxide reductase family protein [Ferruginibacter sp.]|nr:thioredoxin domain-containing protein [Ferruginibacter sp.]
MSQKKTTVTKELSSLALQWLAASGIKTNTAYTKEAITTHPDYPAMTALTDFLESGGMEYDAVQADASYIQEFNYPLLAHIKQPGNEYLHLVNNVSAWDKEKSITKNWSGIALYGVNGATWHNVENHAAEKLAQKNKYTAAAFVIAGLVVFIVSIFIYTNTILNIFGLFSLAGLAISIAALGTELGYQSKLVKQVCSTVGNGGCEKVLGSKFAKGFAGVTPADASVLYFAAQFVLYLVGCFYNPILSGIIIIALAGIAVAGWSVYTQAVKLKEWCALCLCIVAVLVGQIIIAFIQFDAGNFAAYEPYLFFAIATTLLTIVYLPIKQLIKTNIKNKQELASFKKWKTDASLFMAQWEKEPACDNTIWENDLIIGHVDALIRITVACNPYCGPCAKAHVELDKLVEKYPDKVSVQVRLLCNPKNEEDSKTVAIKAILQQAANLSSNSDLKNMLSDWFEWMNYERWNLKWKENNEIDVANVLSKHELWNTETGITHTPTIFVNGRKLPGRYDIKNIEKMLPQLEDAFVVVK